MYHANSNNNFVMGALVGGAVATLTTLLFTTKKGAQIKDMVVEKCHQLEDELSHVKDQITEKASDTVKNAESAAKSVANASKK